MAQIWNAMWEWSKKDLNIEVGEVKSEGGDHESCDRSILNPHRPIETPQLHCMGMVQLDKTTRHHGPITGVPAHVSSHSPRGRRPSLVADHEN